MEITLEKIELVKDRTGSTYNEAKEALEQANGSVVDAIIAIEEDINREFADELGNPLLHKVKEMGEKMDINNVVEKAKDVAEKGLEIGKEYYDKIDKEKVAEYADKAAELAKQGADIAMEKGKELYQLGMEKAEEYQVKDKAMDLIDKIGEKASEIINK